MATHHNVCRCGNSDVVQYLIDNKHFCDTEPFDDKGQSPLHLALQL